MTNKMTTQTIVAVAIGSALFAVLMVYGGVPVFTNTKLTTAYIVPVIVGGLFGVIPAALVGLFGNILADFIGGWGYWFDWSIGNGLAALFIGLLPLYGARIREGIFTVRHAFIFAVVSIFGIAVSFGLVTPLLTQLLYQAEATITFAQAQVAVISNASVVVVVGIPLLFVLANRYRKQTNLTEEF